MFIFEILGAILFANFVEVLLHKFVLHGLGKKKNSLFSHHWKHHNLARKHGFYDSNYENIFKNWKECGGEIYSLIALTIVTLPTWFLFPIAYYTFLVYIVAYYVCHRRMHLNPEWAQKYFNNHYLHHMLGNQEHSWGVLTPIWDIVLKTRYKDLLNKKEKTNVK